MSGHLSVAALAGRRGPGAPVFAFDAASGALPAGSAFTRASGGTRVNARGYLETVATDGARFTYDPALTYNELLDPWFDGCTVGGSPSSFALFAGGGVTWTQTVLEKGLTSDGLPYVVIQGSGTPTNTNGIVFVAGSSVAGNGVAAVSGDTVSARAQATVVAVSGMSVVSPHPALRLYESQDVFLTGSYTDIATNMVTGQEYSGTATRAFNNANTRQGAIAIQFGAPTVGVPVSLTVRMVFPVANKGAAPISNTVPLAALVARSGTTPQRGILGLLLEEASTNILTRSNQFAGLSWSRSASTVTDNQVGPDGVANSAGLFNEGTGAGTAHLVVNAGAAFTSGTTYTASIYLKAGTVDYAQLAFSTDFRSATQGWANFDLTNGVVLNSGDVVGAAIVSAGNGWWRCSITNPATVTSASGGALVVATIPSAASTGRLPVFTGTSRTIIMGAAQVEAIPFPTSHIPTAGAAAARAREDMLLPNTVLSAFTQGTLSYRLATARSGGAGMSSGNSFALHFGNLSTNERIAIRYSSASPHRPIMEINAASATVASFALAAGSPDTFYTGCLAWGGGDALHSWSGAAPVADASAASPAPTLPATFGLNRGAGAFGGTNTIIRFVRAWDKKLTAAQVQAQAGKTS